VLGIIGLAAAIRLPTSGGKEHAVGDSVTAHRLDTATEHG
jgi:hypothetical protein